MALVSSLLFIHVIWVKSDFLLSLSAMDFRMGVDEGMMRGSDGKRRASGDEHDVEVREEPVLKKSKLFADDQGLVEDIHQKDDICGLEKVVGEMENHHEIKFEVFFKSIGAGSGSEQKYGALSSLSDAYKLVEKFVSCEGMRWGLFPI